MDCSTPGFPVLYYLLDLAQTHVHRVGDTLQPSHPLLLLPSIFPSIRVFSNESALCIRWPKYWSFSFISPSNEHPGLISFRMDWLDLLAVQGTLNSLLQHHSSKASILQLSGFFITTALCNSIKLSHAMWGHPRWLGHGGEVWQNTVHWRREWQTTSVFLPWEPHEQCEKTFGVITKNSLPISTPWSFCPLFYSKSFIILGITLKPLINFELMFVYSVCV